MSSPSAIRAAAWETSTSGRTARRVTHRPPPIPMSVVRSAPAPMQSSRTRRVCSRFVELEDLEELRLDRGDRHAHDEDDLPVDVDVCSVAWPASTV